MSAFLSSQQVLQAQEALTQQQTSLPQGKAVLRELELYREVQSAPALLAEKSLERELSQVQRFVNARVAVLLQEWGR
jgi:sensor domain CHASE-containing protein